MTDREGSAQPSRRLAAIMFTDLVGYSALAHRDEGLAIELLERHRGWVREILPRHGGIEIETVGDAFLIEFSGALAAVECAIAIQRRFADYSATAPVGRRMQLRIGIHLGDVEHRDGKVMGDGVNIASRIHGMARPGGICVSEQVHYAVRNRAGLRFRSLGAPVLKNIATRLELFALAGEGMMLAEPARPARLRRLVVPAAGAVLVALAALGAWRFAQRPALAATPSIAVLPFDNLSAEADSGYFTDGLHDTVIGHLARIEGLKVISRTSVLRYRGGQADLRQIGRELGVAHVLEGSVQRSGDKLRVAAQLIDASSDAHVWSSEYDRELADVFAVQADIAQQVAAAVHARLTPRQQTDIARVPTQNQEAYDFYLRAIATGRSWNVDPAGLRQSIEWLERAVALDPDFALAHAELGYAHDIMYWFGFDPTPERRRLRQRSVANALRLGPQLAEAHLVRAMEVYHGDRDYAEALRELEIARKLAPGNARVLVILGAVQRRQARWVEAVATHELAANLDPLNPYVLGEYGWTLELLGRYGDADRVYARALHAGSDQHLVNFQRSVIRFVQTGDLEPIAQALAAVPQGVDPACGPSFSRWLLHWLRREFREAAAVILKCEERYTTGDAGERTPIEFFAALAYAWAGDRERARSFGEKARIALARDVASVPDLVQTRMYLATMLALTGQPAAARVEAERSLREMPVSRDALVGVTLLTDSARVFTLLGDKERAMRHLAQAVALPGGPAARFLQIDPAFDVLRDDPRFVKLIEDRLSGYPKPGT